MYSLMDQVNLWKTICKKFEVIWSPLVDIVVNVDVETNPSINPIRADPGRREKFNLNFYFHTFLW